MGGLLDSYEHGMTLGRGRLTAPNQPSETSRGARIDTWLCKPRSASHTHTGLAWVLLGLPHAVLFVEISSSSNQGNPGSAKAAWNLSPKVHDRRCQAPRHVGFVLWSELLGRCECRGS